MLKSQRLDSFGVKKGTPAFEAIQISQVRSDGKLGSWQNGIWFCPALIYMKLIDRFGPSRVRLMATEADNVNDYHSEH